MHESKTQDQRPIPILNQFTMVQLTIDNAKMPIPNPKSDITDLRARPYVPDVPFVPSAQVSPYTIIKPFKHDNGPDFLENLG